MSLTLATRGRLQVVDDVEDVRGEPVDPPELLHPGPPIDRAAEALAVWRLLAGGPAR